MPAITASYIGGPPSNVRDVDLSKPAAVSVAYSRHCQVWQVSHVHETPQVGSVCFEEQQCISFPGVVLLST